MDKDILDKNGNIIGMELDISDDKLDKLYRICEKLYERLVDCDYYKDFDIYNERWRLFEILDEKVGLIQYCRGDVDDLYSGIGEGEF